MCIRDRLEGSLAVNGTVTEGGYSREELPEYFSGEIKNISDDTFRRLYVKMCIRDRNTHS